MPLGDLPRSGKEHTVFDDNDPPGSDDDDGWFDWSNVGSGPTATWVVFLVLLGVLAFVYFAH